MKKILLLGAMALMVASASATTPQKRSEAKPVAKTQLQRGAMPNVQYLENQMYVPGSGVRKAPRKAGYIENWYNRPAGAFFVSTISVDGDYGYAYSAPFLFMKPFTAYTWEGFADGTDENTTYGWEVPIYIPGSEDETVLIPYQQNAEVEYSMETDATPIFYAVDGDLYDYEHSKFYTYQMIDHDMEGSDAAPTVKTETPVNVFSLPSEKVMNRDGSEVDYWGSSKTMVGGGRYGDQYYTMTAYSGAQPYGDNQRGWWFGKNGQHIDGMGQAFEKPTSPYMLKKVGFYMASSQTRITNPVKLTCNVYKLNEIPAYNDTASVRLPEIPGELIVTGEGSLTQSTIDDNYGFVEFTLYGHDEEDPELTYEYSPTIDYPILVTIEGYNDLDDLLDFTTYISADEEVDEGYGELAYLKYPIYTPRLDENGDTVKTDDGQIVVDFTGEYNWSGLNNFFTSGRMLTGFAIYVCTENPFITFNYSIEDGEYTFPAEGGELKKDVELEDGTYTLDGISFYSWTPSEDGDWLLTWNGVDELPDWLDIELEDVEGAEDEGWEVHAAVTADPLPEGLAYREATIRFEIPGDFIEYKFMQGTKPDFTRGDVNGDGDLGLADINALIDIILGGSADDDMMLRADVDSDGEIGIGDVSALIDLLLSL
ncbi:MAG: dockerin type I repeat-containing protein [Muribaculaceae bacterium]|nr:dockerin type I repeat-containing protein [Muribaculaceae bacterium]